jgi:hypothetical protein
MPLGNFKYGKRELSREEAGIITNEDVHSLNGVYVFVIEGCIGCWKLIEQLNAQGVDYSDWTFVEVLGNMNFFMDDMEIDDMPTVRYYVDGTIRWEMYGVLFPPQVKQLQAAIAKPLKDWNDLA